MANLTDKTKTDMSDDFSDEYFDIFINEPDLPEISEQEKQLTFNKKLADVQDIDDDFQKGKSTKINQANFFKNQYKKQKNEFNNLFSRNNNQNSSNFTAKTIDAYNPILTTSIPWSILMNKKTESSSKSPNGNIEDNAVKLIYATKTEFLLCSVAINHDGSLFAYSDGSNVYFVSLQNGANIYSVRLPDNREIQTRSLCFSKDSKYLAASICNGKIAIISDKSVQAVLSKHTNIVTALSFTDDYLISGGLDNNLIIWKINSNGFSNQTPKSNNYAQGEMSSSSSTTSSSSDSPLFSLHKEIHYQSVISIDICPTDSIIAVSFSNSTVGVFDCKSIDSEKDYVNEKEDFSSSSSMNQENDDSRINSTHSLDNLNSMIGVYSESTMSSPDSSDSPSFDQNQPKSNENSNQTKMNLKIKSFEVHQKPLLGVAVSYKNNFIATCSRDKTAKIWDTSELSNKVNDENNSNSQNILQVQPPSLKFVLDGHNDFVTSVTFSPIDDILFTGSKDEKIKAWNIRNGELLFTLNAHQNTVFAIKHHPTKRIFVSCSGDGLICVWNYMSTGQ